MRLAPASLVFLLLSTFCLLGCDPPETSFAADTSDYFGIPSDTTGNDLKAQLHDLIDDHEALNYRELWDALAYTDQDPNNPGHVILLYTGWSLPADAHGNDPSGWNREHVWSKSRGDFGTRQGAGTDLHAIRPAEVTVNTARGNKAFDEGGEPYIDRDGFTNCRRDQDSWEPRPEVRGDIARMLFYMAVRYEDPELDLELTEDTASQGNKSPAHGVLTTLLNWHQQDPPDAYEQERNNRIEQIQGNRNPFIDRPEFVERIWDTSRQI